MEATTVDETAACGAMPGRGEAREETPGDEGATVGAGVKTDDGTLRIAVSGGDDPDRVLTLRFDLFVESAIALPEPEGDDELRKLGRGADLLLGLMDGGADFGTAAPGEPGDFASSVLALTDDAFDQAHRILAQDPYHHEHFGGAGAEDDRVGFLLRLLDHLADDGIFRRIRDGLLGAEPAEDAAVAGELL
jgi:hypothetical protein